ncbi:hypothetical protein Tco_1078817 [Tanacetum coccineum]|uniref:Uncharacterized protein n=1 Tax=Tanacetum coccineum TaxID=301880 RepID=A0ABQ5HQ23_9ASTR
MANTRSEVQAQIRRIFLDGYRYLSLKESKFVKKDNVIAPGMFRINLAKTSREDKVLPINQARESIRINPITVSQPYVITKKDVNSDSNGLSSTRIDNTAKTRRPYPLDLYKEMIGCPLSS